MRLTLKHFAFSFFLPACSARVDTGSKGLSGQRWTRSWHTAQQEYGADFITASVIDPFGNIVGIMYNKHYQEVPDHK